MLNLKLKKDIFRNTFIYRIAPPSKFSLNMFMDINKEWTTKIKDLSAYKTEINDFPHPRSVEGIEVIAKHWGTVSGFNAAEAFCIVRQLKKNIWILTKI